MKPSSNPENTGTGAKVAQLALIVSALISSACTSAEEYCPEVGATESAVRDFVLDARTILERGIIVDGKPLVVGWHASNQKEFRGEKAQCHWNGFDTGKCAIVGGNGNERRELFVAGKGEKGPIVLNVDKADGDTESLHLGFGGGYCEAGTNTNTARYEATGDPDANEDICVKSAATTGQNALADISELSSN